MIRFVVIGIIVLLALFLVRSFMGDSPGQRPIDVDPVDASSSKGSRAKDDDVIDVDPVED